MLVKSYADRMTSLPHADRTLVMGVVNVTTDSFSDGGEYASTQAAVAHGLQLLKEGADILDVGGESTRPGAVRPSLDLELARVIPVVDALSAAGAVVSVDTMRSEVALASIQHGASMINDVSGGLADPQLMSVVADAEVGFVVMHWRGFLDESGSTAQYSNVVSDVRRDLTRRINAALEAGIAAQRLVADPGLGFSKDAAHNWELLRNLDAFAELGCPLLIGASRKRFLGELLATDDAPRPPKERDDATLALTTLLAARGVWGVRTHRVRAQRDAIAVVEQMA